MPEVMKPGRGDAISVRKIPSTAKDREDRHKACEEQKALEDIISTVNKLGLEIATIHIEQLPEATKKDVCIHVASEDVSQLVTELESKGYKVSLRPR